MTENRLEEIFPENKVFSSRLKFGLNRFREVNRAHFGTCAVLRKSSNLAERIIGVCSPMAHLILAYTFAPLAIGVAIIDAEYSGEKGGYISRSYRIWLETEEES